MQTQAAGNPKYGHYSNDVLLKAYQRGPNRLRACVEGLSLQEFQAVPVSGKWSIAEIIVHLADAEIVGACRIRQIYCGHDGPLPTYDQVAWAKTMNYNRLGAVAIHQYILLFEALRSTTMTFLGSATPEDWAKCCTHPQMGKISLRAALELYADHSERHIAQIIDRRALLGKSIECEVMLPDRLY